MGDQLEFVDDNADVRLAGSLLDPGATEGDVLTVQADGSVAAVTPAAPGSVVQIAAFAGLVDVLGGDSHLRLDLTQIVKLDATVSQNVTQVQTAPLRTVAALAVVATFDTWGVENIDTTPGTYEITVAVYVTNEDASQTITLTGTADATSGGPGDSATISAAGLTVTGQTGSDLTYDSMTGDIASTAGGSFGVVVTYGGGWAAG